MVSSGMPREAPPAAPAGSRGARRPRRSISATAMAIVALAGAGALAILVPTMALRPASGADERAAATFVGSEACAGCHRAQGDLWRGSQHRRAMAHASDETVRADFNDTSFDYAGVHSRF